MGIETVIQVEGLLARTMETLVAATGEGEVVFRMKWEEGPCRLSVVHIMPVDEVMDLVGALMGHLEGLGRGAGAGDGE